jgi:hypothetical protein
MRTRRVAFVAGLALLAAACGASEPVPDASGPNEGIAVHGDWTIAIYDPDGGLDRHHEFSNAFVPSGAALLAGILGDEAYPGTWLVEMHGQDEQPCVSSTGEPSACAILQPTPLLEQALGEGDSSRSLNLEVDVDVDQLILSGSHVASADGQISEVWTLVQTCDVPLGAVECTETQPTLMTMFTRRALTGEDVVEVSAGQSIQVEVVISFTSG